MQRISRFALALVATLGVASGARAAVFGDFEDGTTDGFGTLTNASGVTANSFASGTTGTVVTPTSGTNLTKVLDLTASGFNGGLSSGADLGYDFVAQGKLADFMANNILSFNWEVPPSNTQAGFSQLYNIIINAPGYGFHNVGGVSVASDATDNQNPPFTGQTNTFSFDYTAIKSQITANPGYIQFAIQTNNGGGAPADFYFDNFTLSGGASSPEPASIGLLGMGAMGLIARRRRA